MPAAKPAHRARAFAKPLLARPHRILPSPLWRPLRDRCILARCVSHHL